MPSYILTGAPGAGKTAIVRMLEAGGYPVVEEAATDVIALGQALGRDEPWQDEDFIGKILALQRQRQDAVRADAGTVFFVRRYMPSCSDVSPTAIAKPRARRICPAAEVPRGVPTTGATAIMMPSTSCSVSPAWVIAGAFAR